MCGYCIETNHILNFVFNENFYKIPDLDLEAGLFLITLLQEGEDFPAIIKRMKHFDNANGTGIDLAFCRMWERFLFQGHDDTYSLLVDAFSLNKPNEFLAKMKEASLNRYWGVLGREELYADKECWAQFLKNIDQLIDNAEATLKLYSDFWIRGINKEVSDSWERLMETGLMDPIDNTPPKEWDKFYSLFPMVYFSFLIVKRYRIIPEQVEFIALTSPQDVPDFAAYDLWLQRKAYVVCVENYGVQFILDNYDNVRFELIYYCLLKGLVRGDALDKLENHLLSHKDNHNPDVHILESADILELIKEIKSGRLIVHP